MKANGFFPIWRVGDRNFVDDHKAAEYAMKLARTATETVNIYERDSLQGAWKLHCELVPAGDQNERRV